MRGLATRRRAATESTTARLARRRPRAADEREVDERIGTAVEA